MNTLEDLVLLNFIGTILLVCDSSLDSWKRINLYRGLGSYLSL
jgi:hypothetical protein